MLTVAAWRLHVTVGASPCLHFLEFIRSVVGVLLKTTSFASSKRRTINTSVGLHHTVNGETRGRCSNCKKNNVKNAKNVVFACILCASWITISDKIVSFSSIFVVVSCHLECLRNKKCLQRRQRSEIFL